MATEPDDPIQEEAPYYIRWSPDGTRYAIELKLDLVRKIANEFVEPGKRGVEVGGVLVGSFPKSETPILRIEDIEMIPRRPEDGPIYMLDPIQHQRFAGARWRALARNKVAIGFFRSHVRPGPLRPSLADRSLLTGELSQTVYVLLLIQAREPYSAALFVASDGQLPDEPAVREFRFNEGEFKTLPEIQPDESEPAQDAPTASEAGNRWLKPIVIPLAIAIVLLSFLWWFLKRRPVSNDLQLAVTERGHLLQISWNRYSSELNRASGATLLIGDGASRQEVKLGPDELKLGIVDYQPSAQDVQVTMTVNTPGSTKPEGSVEWKQH